MADKTLGLIKTYIAEADAAAFLIAKPGTADGSVVPATAATDKLMGTYNNLGAENGKPCDLIKGGIGTVKLGGTVDAGDALTPDANSKAIATTTAGNRIIGFAEIAGVADDEIPYLFAPGQL